MKKQRKARIKTLNIPLDAWLFVPLVYLCVIGVVVQWSISGKTAGPPIALNVYTQVAGYLLGIAGLLLFAKLRRQTWRGVTIAGYVFSVMMLVAVLFFGVEVNGSQRWVSIGPLSIQPTEMAKLALIGALAIILDIGKIKAGRWRMLGQVLLLTALPTGFVLLQPDLGSGLVFVFIMFTMLFVSKISFERYIFLILLSCLIGLALMPFMEDYQRERIQSFWSGAAGGSAASYNVEQAAVAIGNGGVWGNGLDGGSQSKLNFLPSQHTDFIFAVVIEKLGLVGGVSVILSFVVIFTRMIILAIRLNEPYAYLLTTGVLAMLASHATINIGMNLGLLPVTGLPLPFVSFGGTFATISVFSAGLVGLLGRRSAMSRYR